VIFFYNNPEYKKLEVSLNLHSQTNNIKGASQCCFCGSEINERLSQIPDKPWYYFLGCNFQLRGDILNLMIQRKGSLEQSIRTI